MNMIAEYEKTDMGTIQIAPEVIEVIAGLATIEVEGIAGMSGGLAGGIAELLGKKNVAKGVKVEVGQKRQQLMFPLSFNTALKFQRLLITYKRTLSVLLKL